jgi:predicted TIM-barrel fold metal-dependent hydrolase
MRGGEEMNQTYSLKIDAYSHIVPAPYLEALHKAAGEGSTWRLSAVPPIYDLDHRFRIMDRYEGIVQVLTLAEPAIEQVADPEKAPDLARLANDELAELVRKYPGRFVGAIACLPMNNVDAALKEVDRAINDLKCRGVLVYSNVKGKPLDSPEFMPLYEKMSGYNLPIYIHPQRSSSYADYPGEDGSRYNVYSVFGWPYETTVAMTRLVFSGILERYPNLKIVTHHCGGMVPYYAERIIQHHDKYEYEVGKHRRGEYKQGLTKAPIDYFKMFYNDTAVHGSTAALMCAYAFFGAGHLLFGADMPLGDRELGSQSYRKTINGIGQMEISDAEKKKVFEDNARNLMRLPI